MLMSISMASRTDIKGAEGHPHVRDSPMYVGGVSNFCHKVQATSTTPMTITNTISIARSRTNQ